jgi:hypothetical protein
LRARGCFAREFHDLGDEVQFQWGEVGAHYRIGDAIQWLMDSDGVVPEFTVTRGLVTGERWNCGTPNYRDVIVFDEFLAERWTELSHVCSRCGQTFAALAVIIRKGRIESAKWFTRGEIEELFGESVPAVIVIIRPDGSYCPMPHWNDAELMRAEETLLERLRRDVGD